jgi:hypothetical protein
VSLLNFRDGESGPAARSRKPFKIILSIGALAGVIVLGSTLAASINLNTGRPVEFGQGVAQATACDSSITLTPNSSFVNANGEGSFLFTGITFTGLDTNDQLQDNLAQGCVGKVLTVKIFGANGNALTPGYSIYVGESEFASSDGTFTNVNNYDGTDTSATLIFNDPEISATDVYRITVESSSIAGSGWVNLGSGGGSVSLQGDPVYSSDSGGYLDFSTGGFATGSIGETSGVSSISVAMRMNLYAEAHGMPFYWGLNDNNYDVFNCASCNGFGFNTFNDDLYGMNVSSYLYDFHNYVFIFDSSDDTLNKIYIDGVEQSLSLLRNTPRATQFPSDGSFVLMQGGISINGSLYHQNGKISEVKIYKRALSDSEAAAVFTGSPPSGAVIDLRASSPSFIR